MAPQPNSVVPVAMMAIVQRGRAYNQLADNRDASSVDQGVRLRRERYGVRLPHMS